jgi:cytochrome c-type biogenesis protein CcmF
MASLGSALLLATFVVCSYAAVASVAGARRHSRRLIESGIGAFYLVAALMTAASAIMINAFLTDDFSIKYVAHYSDTVQPLFYKFTSYWGGLDGSIMFWVFLLSVFGSCAVWVNRERHRELIPYVVATISTVEMFFLYLMIAHKNPFTTSLTTVPADGQGLNPLLQNYWMAIHPPSLYTGYVSAAVPFAFACGALVTRKLDDGWIRTTRRWAIFSWFFLTLGNLFGARWAYEVLGWGGYWAWDPVENAAFMPWLVMTAYLHSVMIQERKDMLKVWNLALIGMAFMLTLFGTFLTRSGVISSVHSFTQSGLGPYFLTFLIVVVAAYTALLTSRVRDLKSPAEFESYLSREAAFLFNNLMLVGIAFAVFWGTVFPVISEAVRGVKITVGPPFFDKVNGPLALGLVFLMGVGPLIAWRRTSPQTLMRTFLAPLTMGVGAGVVVFAMGLRQWYVLTALSLAAFALGTVVVEFRRGVSARRHLVHETPARALVNLVSKNNRRYGGYIIHLGVVFAFIGIVASSFFRTEVKRSVREGQTFSIGAYEITFLGLKGVETAHLEDLSARLAVRSGGREIATMEPARLFYKRPQQPATRVAIRSTPLADLYVVLAGVDDQSGLATFEVFLTPLVFWLWAGGLMMAIGTVVVMWPNVRERAAMAAALGRDEALGAEPVPGGD